MRINVVLAAVIVVTLAWLASGQDAPSPAQSPSLPVLPEANSAPVETLPLPAPAPGGGLPSSSDPSFGADTGAVQAPSPIPVWSSDLSQPTEIAPMVAPQPAWSVNESPPVYESGPIFESGPVYESAPVYGDVLPAGDGDCCGDVVDGGISCGCCDAPAADCGADACGAPDCGADACGGGQVIGPTSFGVAVGSGVGSYGGGAMSGAAWGGYGASSWGGGSHVRYPHYSYRRPWYTPGPASQNLTIAW